MALLAPSRQPIKRQNLHPFTTFDCGLPDRQKARAYAVEAISSVAVCTSFGNYVRFVTRLVVKAIKAERPESTQSGSSLAPHQFTTMTQCGPSPHLLRRSEISVNRRSGNHALFARLRSSGFPKHRPPNNQSAWWSHYTPSVRLSWMLLAGCCGGMEKPSLLANAA